MSTAKNLSDAITRGDSLTEKQKEELFSLLSGRTRQQTRETMARRFALPLSLWPNYGIFSRVHFDADGGVSYCAGQDYPAEITYIRGLIIKG